MRIVAGRLRGRPIRAPQGRATRPTADRVRQSLFELLGDISGARVADLYAGSGALGIEALSRGAEHASFVESASAAVACLRENLRRLGLTDRALVVRARVERARAPLLRLGPYDLILCDPPWPRVPQALAALARLLRPDLLAASCTVVIEHSARRPVHQLTCPGLELTERRIWGDSAASFFAARVQDQP